MGIKTETYTNDNVNFMFSGLKTYFICGRVAPDINPIKTRPEGPVAVMKTSTFVLQTDMINESNYQVEMIHSNGDIFENCVPQHPLPF